VEQEATAMGELHGRYHHVSVCVSDLDRARAFYGGRLGLKEIARPAFKFPGVWYALDGDIALHIMVTEWPAPRPAPERFDLVHPHFALWTDDADQTFERLHAAGLSVHDFISTPTGLRQLFVDDPDGNRVEFIGPTRSPRTVRMEEGR
jgi:catechol 2,3-dioxygenase-like lactoylglutathione lyase family enzyme